jgi:hypothetical protein
MSLQGIRVERKKEKKCGQSTECVQGDPSIARVSAWSVQILGFRV